ncbi:TD and POZ domain-containing protein 5 [Araneus ventricosus]|uniref:TD and POZ domain-containing protein 5 n=1 Tax=Araneus ventricosus TaxID=182803 RepID=A0A4Y2CG15_ARAVE|nr:TD and POZ domain-containing protein 5 [Araneus ventricosus]
MDKEKKEYKYLWFIENYSCSYRIAENGEALTSPKFTIDGLQGTAWELLLYPKGCRHEYKGNVSLFLRRCEDNGPKDIYVKFQLSVLAVDGSALHTQMFSCRLKTGISQGCNKFLQADEIHLRRKAEYLPKDTLSVCCKMWKGEGEAHNVGQISARTRILTEKISFLHVVESFSRLQPNVKQTIKIPTYSKEGRIISSFLYFIDGSCCEKKIMIKIVISDAKYILQKCEFSLLDRSGNKIECGRNDYGSDAARSSINKLPLSLTREVILKRKGEFLPRDKLSLLCECTFYTGIFAAIEDQHDLPLAVVNQKYNPAHSKNVYIAAEKRSQYPSATEDMKAIYLNQYLTDVELKTKTKSFPAHKNVLCARSPVFKTMLTSDMKEKNIDCIRVDDMENDTVHQLLLFLYSDNIEILPWKSASQLYYAAAKYQIGKLKALCCSFMVKSLSISNASQLLLLADTHNDANFKKVVEDFILEHEEQVFISNGWEKLIEKNHLLVIKTMQLKYKRKYEAN